MIRQATIGDIQVMLPLVNAYWKFEGITGYEPEKVATQLMRLLSNPALGNGWIAFSGEVATGYLLGVYVFSLEHLGVTAEIDELFVSPRYRRLGVGKALLETAESAFVRAGCANVSLQLSVENDNARGFYFRRGYKKRAGYELLEKTLPSG